MRLRGRVFLSLFLFLFVCVLSCVFSAGTVDHGGGGGASEQMDSTGRCASEIGRMMHSDSGTKCQPAITNTSRTRSALSLSLSQK